MDTRPAGVAAITFAAFDADAARMGRAHAVTTAANTESRTSPLAPLARAVDFAIASVVLVVALPLMGVLALLVRQSSHGPVLHREPGFDRRGNPIQLLSFRTAVDGAGTVHHGRLRAVVGASERETLTAVGRVLRATRLDRLPRLYNIAAGHTGLLGR